MADRGLRKALSPRSPLTAVWRWLAAIVGSRYRPERHYMRGPGPKWQERHSAQGAQSTIEDLA
jgi:hypothetical protein